MSSTYIEIKQLCQQTRARTMDRSRYAQKVKQKAAQRAAQIQEINHKVAQSFNFIRLVEIDTFTSRVVAINCDDPSRIFLVNDLSSLNEKTGDLQNLLQSEAEQSLELEPLSIDSSKRYCELVQLGVDLEQRSQEIKNTRIDLEDRLQKLEQLKHYLLSRFALAIEQKESQINSLSSEIPDEMPGSDIEELEEILILLQDLATGGN